MNENLKQGLLALQGLVLSIIPYSSIQLNPKALGLTNILIKVNNEIWKCQISYLGQTEEKA